MRIDAEIDNNGTMLEKSLHYENSINSSIPKHVLMRRKEMSANTYSEVYRSATEEDATKTYKWDIVWTNVFLLGILHVVAVYGLYLRIITTSTFYAVVVVKMLAVLSSIGITAGAHRLWTHRCYDANFPLQCLLMVMATLTYQNSVFTWARDHRLHHKCSETDADPHNAKRGFFFSHVGWLLVRKHPEVLRQGKTIDMSDLETNPVVMFQHKYYYPLVFLGALVLPYYVAYWLGSTPMEAFVRAVVYKFVVSVNLTWCINSVAHIFGQRPYDKDIGSTESQLMRFLGFGEGFHNYHHTFPWDYKASEFHNDTRNLTTCFIDFFAWLGWATNLKEASREAVDRRCDRTGSTGREYHMMKGNPDRLTHNIVSFFAMAVYIYVI